MESRHYLHERIVKKDRQQTPCSDAHDLDLIAIIIWPSEHPILFGLDDSLDLCTRVIDPTDGRYELWEKLILR